jgi:hypothetical protein
MLLLLPCVAACAAAPAERVRYSTVSLERRAAADLSCPVGDVTVKRHARGASARGCGGQAFYDKAGKQELLFSGAPLDAELVDRAAGDLRCPDASVSGKKWVLKSGRWFAVAEGCGRSTRYLSDGIDATRLEDVTEWRDRSL